MIKGREKEAYTRCLVMDVTNNDKYEDGNECSSTNPWLQRARDAL